MLDKNKLSNWKLEKGKIYSDVYNKRTDERPVNGFASLQRATILDNRLYFPSADIRSQAINDGVFFLKIPSWINLEECDSFASNFYRGEHIHKYGKFREITSSYFNDPLLGCVP